MKPKASRNIPTNISLTSSGNTIEALWEEDKRGIPLVVRAAKSIRLGKKNKNVGIKSINFMLIIFYHIIWI